MRFRSWTACVAIAAMTAGASAASASAETTTFDLPVSGTVPNECTAEMVAIEGTSHNKFTNNSSLSGIKSQMEVNLTGIKGTGVPSGARYVMNDQTSSMDHEEFDPMGNAQLTTEASTILTRQGEWGALLTGDDFRLHVLMHLTIVNGVPRADSWDMRSDCR
jgi:hypothetical protein